MPEIAVTLEVDPTREALQVVCRLPRESGVINQFEINSFTIRLNREKTEELRKRIKQADQDEQVMLPENALPDSILLSRHAKETLLAFCL